MPALLSFGSALLVGIGAVHAIQLNPSNSDSIKAASKTVAASIVSLYQSDSGPAIPGLFPQPSYFGQDGLAWNSLIDYWALTGDDSYNALVQDALLWQVGQTYTFMPVNQTRDEGNDDQSTWGLAAVNAAERGFPAPSSNVSWIDLAANVFESQVLRWDAATCNGGLRWQIFSFNAGWDYKNTASNGNFLELAARLGRFTGNTTYIQWAQKVADWSASVGLTDREYGQVYDGSTPSENCSTIDHLLWTIDSARYIGGAAYAFNETKNASWADYSSVFVNGSAHTFTVNDIITDVACELPKTCGVYQKSYKSTLISTLAKYKQLVPSFSATINARINTILNATAVAAAASCTGGSSGSVCGFSWYNSSYDGSVGLGQDLDALQAFLALLPPVVLNTANSTPTGASGSNSTTTSPGASSNSSTPTTHANATGFTGGSAGFALTGARNVLPTVFFSVALAGLAYLVL